MPICKREDATFKGNLGYILKPCLEWLTSNLKVLKPRDAQNRGPLACLSVFIFIMSIDVGILTIY